jgi:hypothetical protein
MRIVSPFLGALLMFGSLAACGSDDKVLDPDETGDGDGDSKQGDGDGDTGDGDTGDGDGGDTGDGDDGAGDGDGDGAPTTVAKDADCDLNGIWAARQVTESTALGIAPQFASNWYYLEFAQDGENVVVKKHFDCGIQVRGTVTVVLTRETGEALMQHNVQTGRKGTMKKVNGKCEFTMERFWSIRGADEAKYRPTGSEASGTVAALKTSNPLPSKANTDGAEDWDQDGTLGVAWQVTGAASGTRNTVQRDWTEWFSDSEFSITPAKDWTSDVVTRAKFDNEENVLAPNEGLLTELSKPNSGAKHTLTLQFLGRDKSDARAKGVIKSEDFDTCLAIQGKLPAPNKL